MVEHWPNMHDAGSSVSNKCKQHQQNKSKNSPVVIIRLFECSVVSLLIFSFYTLDYVKHLRHVISGRITLGTVDLKVSVYSCD